LVIAPSIACQSQSIPFSSSYSNKPCCHIARNTPASPHSWKRRWALLLEQIPVALKAFHWQPVRSKNRIASMARRLGTREL
jgi:hypothetical protein